nr:translation initiation factor IF-2 [Delphinus delphis]
MATRAAPRGADEEVAATARAPLSNYNSQQAALAPHRLRPVRGLLGAVPARAVAPQLRGPWSAALWLPRLGNRWPEPSSPGGGSPASERLPGRWGRQPGPRRGGGDRGGSARPLLGRSPGSRGRGVAAPAASDAAAAAAAAEAATAAGGRGEAAAQCGTGPGVGRAMRGGCPTAAPGRHLASSSPQSLVAAAAVVHGAREPLGQLDAAESAPRTHPDFRSWFSRGDPGRGDHPRKSRNAQLHGEGPRPSAVTPHSSRPPPALQPLICFLSPWTRLFWLFRTGGLTRSVAFCVCLLWLNMLARVIHVVTDIKFTGQSPFRKFREKVDRAEVERRVKEEAERYSEKSSPRSRARGGREWA